MIDRDDIKARMQGNLTRGTPLARCIEIEHAIHFEPNRIQVIAEVAFELGSAQGNEEGIRIGVEAERDRDGGLAFLEIRSGDLPPEAVERIRKFTEDTKGGTFKAVVIEEEGRSLHRAVSALADKLAGWHGIATQDGDHAKADIYWDVKKKIRTILRMDAEGVTEEDMARDPADVSTMRGTDR